ncbi:MAG: peptidylprolyl isomerase [Pseudomonadota bacterium]
MNQKPTLNSIWPALTALIIGVLFGAEALAADASAPDSSTPSSTPAVFARVGNTDITWRDFNSAYADASRSRFYHGKPPEAEVAALQREIGNKLVTDALLLSEAKRIKLRPDTEVVKQKLEQYDQRNAGSEQWQKIRDRALPVLAKRYEEESLISQLEQRVRKVRAPSEKQLHAYYQANLDKFTEPEQLRVSVILLSIEPGLPVWDETRKKAEVLVKQLREGADFAEMAKLHSGDKETVNQGGDMGYLHGGMLSEMSQQAIDKLKPGEISDPVGLMEGIGIFKLTDRKKAKVSSFDAVRERARELYMAEEGERAWKSLIAKLRKKTPVTVDESRFLPLPKPAEKATAKPVALPETQTAGEPAAGK